MILATHALVGAAIGKNIENPWLVIALSLTIHFAIDSFRHGEYFDSRIATIKSAAWKVILDLGIGGGIILTFLFGTQADSNTFRNVILGSFFSMFPDLITVIYWTFHWKFLEKIMAFHAWAHRYSRFPKFSRERQWTLRNARNDILLSALALIMLFFL